MKTKEHQLLSFSIIEYCVEPINNTDLQQPDSEYHDLVIIGGNIAGLSCSFFSKVKDFIILDRKHQMKELSFKQHHDSLQSFNKAPHLSLLYNQLGLKIKQLEDLRNKLITAINKRLRLNSLVVDIKKEDRWYKIKYINHYQKIEYIYTNKIVFNLPLSTILKIASETVSTNKDQEYLIKMDQDKTIQIETNANSSIIILTDKRINTIENAVTAGYLAAQILNKTQQ